MTDPGSELPGVAPSGLERGFTKIAIACLYAMAAIITVNVISRWMGRALIPDDIQIVSELMVLVILMPLAAVTAMRDHISVDLFTARVAGRPRVALALLEHGVGLVFAGLVTWAAWKGAVDAWESQDYYNGVLDMPMWVGHFTFLAGMATFLLRLAVMFIRDLRRIV